MGVDIQLETSNCNVIKLSDNDKEGINKKIGSFFLSIFSYVLLTPNQKCAANYSFLLNE